METPVWYFFDKSIPDIGCLAGPKTPVFLTLGEWGETHPTSAGVVCPAPIDLLGFFLGGKEQL